MFWTLRTVLGSEDYDLIMHTAWIKFYSRMLDVIVPIVLEHEMTSSHAKKEFNPKIMMPHITTVEMAKQGLVDEETTRTI